MKQSRVYKFRINKLWHYTTNGQHRAGSIFWDSSKKGTYRRGMETVKSFMSKLNPFDKQRS